MRKLEWIINTIDPILPASTVMKYYEDAKSWQYEEHMKYLQNFIIGDPMPNAYHSVEQLKAVHMVGVYQEEQTLRELHDWLMGELLKMDVTVIKDYQES